MELRDWSPETIAENARLMECKIFGGVPDPRPGCGHLMIPDFQRDAHGRPIERGFGAPGRETENHFDAIRKYEGPEAERAARAAAKLRKTTVPAVPKGMVPADEIQALIAAAVAQALAEDRAKRDAPED
jgi:hypothetical protein